MAVVRKYSSRAQKTTLASAVTSSSASITVVSAAALMGGKTLTANQRYTIVIDPDTALEEIVQVFSSTANPVSTNTIAIARGIDGSIPQAHSAGAEVRHMAIGEDYQEANDHINQTTGTAHGLVLTDVVKKTDTGTVSTQMLADNAATTAKIADASITTSKIADGSITGAKISNTTTIARARIGLPFQNEDMNGYRIVNVNSPLDAGHAANKNYVDTSIANISVATGNIADSAVTSAKILDGTIATGDIADGAITSAKIADATIVNADISATAAISKSKLNLGGTITSADLVDGTIVASDIADGTITAAKMIADPYARANHTGTQTASTISNFDAQVRTSKVTDLAAPTGAFSMNSQKVTNLAEPTVATDASTKGYVDTQVNNLVNGAPGTLDTLGEIAAALSSGGSVVSTLVAKSGDTMTGPLTLSGAPTSALHAATKAYVDGVAGSTAAAQAAQAAAEAALDSFDDRYLGAKLTPPSLDNDGNALITGAIYWNSVANAMYAWTGTEWGSISSTADIYRYRFTSMLGGNTSVSGLDDNGLTLNYLPGKEQVYLNGVLLVRSTDYVATDGVTIASLAALAPGDILEVITFTSFELADAINRATLSAKGDLIVGVAASTPGALPVGGDGKFLKADSSTATGLVWDNVPNPDLTPYATEIMTIMGAY